MTTEPRFRTSTEATRAYARGEITGAEYAHLDATLPSAADLARLSREEQQDARYTDVLDRQWRGDFDAVTAANLISDLREGKRITMPTAPAPVERAPEPTRAEVSADRATRRAQITAELNLINITRQFVPGGLLQSVADADKLANEGILEMAEWNAITENADNWRLPWSRPVDE